MIPLKSNIKPTQLKIMEGNPGKKKLPVDEPEPRYIQPDPPPHLSPEALKEWERICVGLFHMKLLAEVDGAALAAYCTSYGLWENAWKILNKLEEEEAPYGGMMIITPNGTVMQNPLIGIANKAARDMMRYCVEFGMTPAARARMGVRPEPKRRSKFGEGLLGGKSS